MIGGYINIFTNGDASTPATWSNVPYCLSTTLEQFGYKVNRIDISLQNRPLLNLYRRIWTAIVRRYMAWRYKGEQYAYTFDRTPLYCRLVEKEIKKANERYPDALCNIFLSFSCRNRYSKAPSILLCDWTFEHLIREQFGRTPNACEQRYIDLQNEAINGSDHVVSLFERSAQYIAQSTGRKEVAFLGGNVVNIVGDNQPDKSDIEHKIAKHNILFIGGYRYRQAAQQLVTAYDLLRQRYPDIKIDIVGQTESDLGVSLPDNGAVRCYGYLDKADEQQRTLYYRLLREASLLVNHNPVWGGYSSTIEAMLFYTPIVVAPYEEFVNEFGCDTSFAEYCNDFSVEALVQSICRSFDSETRRQASIDAHAAVEEYTWSAYVKKLEKLIK
jgi:glycosyltransferase involved in cell wall biosynthesis